MNRATRLSPATDVHARRFHDEVVVLDLVRGEYFALDDMGAKIWEAFCDGRSAGEIVGALAVLYDADVARLETDVFELGRELMARGLFVEVTKDVLV